MVFRIVCLVALGLIIATVTGRAAEPLKERAAVAIRNLGFGVSFAEEGVTSTP